jgi:hypothetical protein
MFFVERNSASEVRWQRPDRRLTIEAAAQVTSWHSDQLFELFHGLCAVGIVLVVECA